MVVSCAVPSCKNKSRYRVPSAKKSKDIRQKWLDFLKYTPHSRKGLCEVHFTPDQFKTIISDAGHKLDTNLLKDDAVPTILITKTAQKIADPGGVHDQNVVVNNLRKQKLLSQLEIEQLIDLDIKKLKEFESKKFKPSNSKQNEQAESESFEESEDEVLENHYISMESETDIVHTFEDSEQSESINCETNAPMIYIENSSVIENIQAETEISTSDESGGKNDMLIEQRITCNEKSNDVQNENDKTSIKFSNHSTQTNLALGYTIHDFRNNNEAISYFTGLDNYRRFQFVLESLGPEVYSLNYRHWKVLNLSIEDQLFITLWKLRRNTTDFELSIHFRVSTSTIDNVFLTWIPFMAKQWKKLNVWPDRQLVYYFMPGSFKKNVPSTRVILAGMEIHIEAPSQPRHQQASFSTYKHDNTLKAVGGLFSYWSPTYAASTSDRQIIEQSNLFTKCDPKDLVMVDRGFQVQDLFGPHDAKTAIPTFLKKKSHFDSMTLSKDRELAKHRVHIERLIRFAKGYRMLSEVLNHCYVSIIDDIVSVCLMLCNFQECIMK